MKLAGLVTVVLWAVQGTARAQDVPPPSPTPASSPVEAERRAEIIRGLREYLFLHARVGGALREVGYSDGADAGPGGRSELRVQLNGAAGGTSPFGAYFGLGFVAYRPRTIAEDLGDPLADPYEDFDLRQNLRVFGAYAEYTLRDEDKRPVLSLRAGRLANLDRGASLLLCDGLAASAAIGRPVRVDVYGGRRAVLDGNFADGLTDIPVQLCAGGEVQLRFGAFLISAGHRYEEIQRPHLGLDWAAGENLQLGLRAELLLSGLEDQGTAVLLRTDGDVHSTSGRTGAGWLVELQLGHDPRPFGRGGLVPRDEDVRAAARLGTFDASLDRLFFGSEGAHVRVYADAEHWLVSWLALGGGAFTRVMLGGEATSLRPTVFEVWAGPALMFARGTRAGTEVSLALEDPGPTERIFSGTGDGVRRRTAIRAFGEVPIALDAEETLNLSFRPEVETSITNTRGPLSETENQAGFAAGLAAAFVWSRGLRVAARYGFESQAEVFADGVGAVHGVELWLEGTY